METEREIVEYTTLSGFTVKYPRPGTRLGPFLDSVRTLLECKSASEDDMVGVVYGSDNPLLERGMFEGRGAVTAKTLRHPLYRVMADMVFRKRVIERGIDVQRLAAQFDVTLDQATEIAGLSRDTLVAGVRDRQFASWQTNGTPQFRRRDLEQCIDSGLSFVRVGHKAGALMKLRSDAPVRSRSRIHRNVIEGWITDWSRIALLTKGELGARLFVLRRGEFVQRFTFNEYFVEGAFEIVEKVNNSRRARERWREFPHSPGV